MDLTETAVRDIEAYRHKTANVELEEGLSLASWVNERIKPAVMQAASMAKFADAATQYEAWVELGAIVVARAEQVLRHQIQSECQHDWSTRPSPEERCPKCSISLGELLASQERAELADQLEAEDKAREDGDGEEVREG